VFEDANGAPFNHGPYTCHDGELTQ
jgi:hypothetical protein